MIWEHGRPLLAAAVCAVLFGCGTGSEAIPEPPVPSVSVPFEKYELANGLDVVLHVDRSDPIAAVVMTFHVGSSREVEGKTGFAHLFEHLFFLDSEHLGPGGLDRLMTRIGSATNGTTNRDRTNYFEVVPIDGLEKTLWAESDKLGFFINTVTESVVAKEKQVVKNEKRQRIDNQPYGHTGLVVDQALYPSGHPYRWQVIGSMADLDGAALADVVDFHRAWYGPNNATLVVAGDLNVDQTKAWIEQYFAEIPSRPMPTPPPPPPVVLEQTTRVIHQDNYARLPALTLTWPSVGLYHPDSYALDVLADLLADGRSSPFHKVIVEDEQLAPSVVAANDTSELAGDFSIRVRAFDGVDLDDVNRAVAAAFRRFEEEGVPPDELRRVKAGYEAEVYAGLASVRGKAFELANANVFADDPARVTENLDRLLAVTDGDVRRVYETYVKGRPHVAASFVPRGRADLALEGAEVAPVPEEAIVEGAEDELTTVVRGDAMTPSLIDRAVEPPFGEPRSRPTPDVWRLDTETGIQVLGIVDDEVPLVQFELRIKGGQLLDDPALVGVANLLAETMTRGTATRTAEELEQAIDLLGASIAVTAEPQSFVMAGTTLARNFVPTMALVEEMLLEPRFDPEEFDLARSRVRNVLQQRASSPVALAEDVFGTLVYGDHILAQNRLGRLESIDTVTLEDLRAYHSTNLSPAQASFHVAGAVTRDAALASLAGITQGWHRDPAVLPAAPVWEPSRAGLYFVDVPNASQSVLQIGYLAVAESDAEFYPASVMNFRLGGGGFASDLTQVLREQRGYTYGIRSSFSGTDVLGPFRVFSSVRSNVTLEALTEIKRLMDTHGSRFDAQDLQATQSYLLRANAGALETREAKLGLLADMSAYGFPADYLLRREQIVRDMTIDRIRELADRYLDPARMVWLVVGDARTQRPRLGGLGLGDPILLTRDGVPQAE